MAGKWKDWRERVRLAWRVLMGQAVMYQAKGKGKLELEAGQDLHVVGCTFSISELEFCERETDG